MREFTNLVFPKKENMRDAYLVTHLGDVHILEHVPNNNNPIVRNWINDLYRTPSGQILEVDSCTQLAFINNGKVLADSNEAIKFFTDDTNYGYMLFVRGESTFDSIKTYAFHLDGQNARPDSMWVLHKNDMHIGKLEHIYVSEYKDKLAGITEHQVFNNFDKAMKAMHDVIDTRRTELSNLIGILATNTNLIQNWVNHHSLAAQIKEKAFSLVKKCVPGKYYAFSKDADFNSIIEGIFATERLTSALHLVNLTSAVLGVKENTLYAYTNRGEIISNENVLLLTEKDYAEIVFPIINNRNAIYAMKRLIAIYRGRYSAHAYNLGFGLNDKDYRGGFNIKRLKEMVNETTEAIKQAQKYNALK